MIVVDCKHLAELSRTVFIEEGVFNGGNKNDVTAKEGNDFFLFLAVFWKGV